MRLSNILFILLILFGVTTGFDIEVNAAFERNDAGVPAPIQTDLRKPGDPLRLQEHRIVLDPFFRFLSKDSKVWIERIIVTLLTALPKDSFKEDINGPTFRMKIYDLLQSEKPEAVIQAQVLASLQHQLGLDIDATVQITRSVMIVR